MSLLLIGVSVLVVALLFWRVTTRARLAIRRWADEYGYRVESARFHAAFSTEYREAGREAEVVYRVVLASRDSSLVPDPRDTLPPGANCP